LLLFYENAFLESHGCIQLMKILHIIYDDIGNPWCGGGGALRVFQVNRELAGKNDITVLTGNYPGARSETINNVRFIRIGLSASYVLSRLSFSLCVPFVINRHAGDIVVNECSYFSPCFADIYTRRPVVNVIHHLMGRHSFELYPLIGFYPYLAEKVFLKTIRNVITSAWQIRQDIQRRRELERSVNIANGVAADWYTLAPQEGRFILFLGRIDIYMKGLDVLLEAFARLDVDREIRLKIAGGGKAGDVERLTALIAQSGVRARIDYLGRVSEEEKRELMQNCLFFVMPSRFEGWGITGVEANAAGKAVVGTRIKGLAEAVRHNETAILIEPENPAALAAAMQMLVKEHTLRRKLGREGRRWARKFTWPAIAADQFRFYGSVLAGGR
jgi:glycosyltransferase involved in cell wall biosynthesis